MIDGKKQVAGEVFAEGSGEMLLTEMDDATLLEFVKLDIRRATDG